VRRLEPTLSLYRRILGTYRGWARTLLPLAVVVFVPIGLIHAVPVHTDVNAIDLDGGIKVFLLATAVMALAATGLIGEVFYAGAVSIALTHPHGGEQPSLREVARMISYRRLIAIDLIFVVVVAAGLALFIVPGLLAFIYLGLAAPVIEIERRTVRESLRRSFDLVRGHFWLVATVLIPIEVGGDAISFVAAEVAHDILGGSFFAAWAADTLSNLAVTPFYAVAVVLLTVDLIADRDGERPRINPTPVPST
jgi:hypothetical protein